MRSIRLTTFILLCLAIAAALATPLNRRSARAQLARQVEATTAQPVQAKTGYPPAGFRPHIPFELPNERKSTELPAVTNAPSPADTPTTSLPNNTVNSDGVDVDVEVIVESEGENENDNDEKVVDVVEVEQQASTTEAPRNSVQGDIDIEIEIKEDNPTAEEVETHTPANEYGPPVVDINANSADSERVEEPVGHFQPPNKDAEEFATPKTATDATIVDIDAGSAASNADADAPAQPVADFPTADVGFTPTEATPGVDNNSVVAPFDVSSEFDGEQQPVPAVTYGPPTGVDGINARLPADTYGTPGGAVVPPAVEEEDFGVELNELEPTPSAEDADLAAEQIELLSGFGELQSGRLIFVPSDGSNLRQIFFGAPPQQRRADKNGRLMRV